MAKHWVRKCVVTKTFETGTGHYDIKYVKGDFVYFGFRDDDDEIRPIGKELDAELAKLHSWNDIAADRSVYKKDFKNFELVQDFDTYDEAIIDAEINKPAEPDLSTNAVSIQQLLSSENTKNKTTSTAVVAVATDYKAMAVDVASAALTYSRKAKNHIKLVKELYEMKAKNYADALEKKAKAMSEELAAKMKEVTAMMNKAKEALWTVNLYLGVNQEVTIIRDGKHASADLKVCMRQKILAMDEEAALEYFSEAIGDKDSSIDCTNISKFDDLILNDPVLLNKLVPEEKCVIGMCIRRTPKRYEDDPLDMKNEANLKNSFLLIKNGDALYRIYVDIFLGMKLFPTEDDFQDNLTKKTYNKETQQYDYEPLDPTSKEFADAMDRADANTKHYMRVLLVLQGLFDRSEVFRPFKGERINICSYKDFDEHVTLIDDANAHKLLEEDKMPYDEWITKVNSGLQVGHRVCGHLESVPTYGDGRRVNPNGAESPSNNTIYTIEKSESNRHNDELFYIYYPRTEEKYMPSRYGSERYRQGYRYEKRRMEGRVRCALYKSDWWLIDVDNCEIEDIKYYLRSRKEKSNNKYAKLVPVMKSVLAIKEQEAIDEKPFRELLINKLSTEYSITDRTKAEQDTDQLIKWWKNKNKTHRALLSDDTKAYNMILAEYKHMLKRQVSGVDIDIVDLIKKQLKKEILLVAKKGHHNVYVTYEISHPWSPALVDEKEWTIVAGLPTLTKDKPESVVDARYMRWLISDKNEKWEEWPKNPNPYKLVTQAHIDKLVEEVKSKYDRPVAIDVTKEGTEMSIRYVESTENLLTTRSYSSSWYSRDERKCKNSDTYDKTKSPFTQVIRSYHCSRIGVCNVGKNNNGLTYTIRGRYHESSASFDHTDSTAYKFDISGFQDSIKTSQKEIKKLKAVQKRLTEKYDDVVDLIVDKINKRLQKEKKDRFIKEYGRFDEDLWEEWSKARPMRDVNRHDKEYSSTLSALLNLLILVAVKKKKVAGMKISDFIKKMKKVYAVERGEVDDGMHSISGCKHCKRLHSLGRYIGLHGSGTCGGFNDSMDNLLELCGDLKIPAPKKPKKKAKKTKLDAFGNLKVPKPIV